MEPLLQRLAENSKPPVEPMPLHGVASVQPVTYRLKLAVGLLTHSLQLTQYPSVKSVTLDQLYSRYTLILLTSLHRCLLRWGIGSSGAEGLVSGHLTSSLDNSTVITPMPNLTPSVQPVQHFFLHLTFLDLHLALKLALMPGRRFFRQPSDAPILRHRLNRCYRFQ